MQLGLWIQLQPADDVAGILAQVAALGFASVHAHFPAGCDAAMARTVAAGAAAARLELAAVSGYANPLRPHEAPMGYTLAQLAGLIDLMPQLGAQRLVSWSGTYGVGLLDDHPDNQNQRGWDALRQSVEQLLPRLEAANAVLLLEPFFSHVLNRPERIVSLIQQTDSTRVGTVLDPPNLLPPHDWPQQTAQIRQMTAVLARHIGLVHCKDMRMEGERLELPGPGQGILDYPTFLQALSASAISAPLIVEHVRLDQAAAARHFVLDIG